MKFCDKLNEYIGALACTAKELSEQSGISAATISRYRSGERVPETESDAFSLLVRALLRIAAAKGTPLDEDEVRAAFSGCEDLVSADKEQLRLNFNTLISVLDINIARLCRSTNYDSSTIFRFRNGSRRPADPVQFAEAIAAFVAGGPKEAPELSALAELIGCATEDIADPSARYTALRSWLLEEREPQAATSSVADFLNKLDSFDLNEYIKAIHFDELKVPTMPFQLPTAKAYFGLKEMMESELDFLKATVLSKSMQPVTMYSDMPMTEMAKDPEFPKKWMFGMAMMLKKGLHLNQIHNLDRSFEDMMLGLESWIPLYMTGQISPYYFKNIQNTAFLHFLKVSGAAALSGEAISGYHADGKYYLTKSRREMEYYQKRADEMLANANPLMDIYRSERENALNAFLLADAHRPGGRRSILSAPPLYTANEALLTGILRRNGIAEEEQQRILKHAAAQRQRVLHILETESIEEEIAGITVEEFAAAPLTLELSGVFCEKDVAYTYEEYRTHLEETAAFAAAQPHYTLKKTAAPTFRNLQIRIHEGQWVTVSKGKAPAIHFVIRHPKLRAAIENFIPPVVEQD